MRTILVCCGTGCIASGSLLVADALRAELAKTGNADHVQIETLVKQTGCNGFCENGPIVQIMPEDIAYYRVKPEDTADVIASLDKDPVERLLYRGEDGKVDGEWAKFQRAWVRPAIVARKLKEWGNSPCE